MPRPPDMQAMVEAAQEAAAMAKKVRRAERRRTSPERPSPEGLQRLHGVGTAGKKWHREQGAEEESSPYWEHGYTPHRSRVDDARIKYWQGVGDTLGTTSRPPA
eukprot:4942993-Lingulodinium_polyedra.AAC.1